METILAEAAEVGTAIDLLVPVGTVAVVEDLLAATMSPLDQEEPREEDMKTKIDTVAADDQETTTTDHGRGIMRAMGTMTREANEGIRKMEERFVGRISSSSPAFVFRLPALLLLRLQFLSGKQNAPESFDISFQQGFSPPSLW